MLATHSFTPEAAPPLTARRKADALHFDALHEATPDPWKVRTDWYERHKRELMLSMLPRERYALGFEPGCSIGENTAALASRCERLIAADFSGSALRSAKSRLADRPQVRFECWEIPERWPDEPLDLIVIAELAYYLSPLRLD